MQQNYNYCLSEVLKSEGGYTNDPRDPGGPTNFGITIFDYRAYINKNGTATDVKNMTLDQAKAIYKAKYWNAMNCDNLPSGVDYTVFDYGVNSGIGRAVPVYKRLAKTNTDPVKLINAICDERMAFLQSLRTWSAFGRGWSTRVASVRSNSVRLASAPNTASHGSAGAVVVAGGAALTQTPHNYWPYIIGGTLVAAVVVWLAIRYFKKGSQ